MTLCEDCKNGIATMCSFMSAKPKDIEETILSMGLKVERKVSVHNKLHQYTVYCVNQCPNYEPGKIPPIVKNDRPAVTLREAKSMNPRKTRYEIAKDKMTREVYLDLKAQGKKDTEIGRQFDIAFDVFFKLKKEYQEQDANQGEPVINQDTITQDTEQAETIQDNPIQTEPNDHQIIWIDKDICDKRPTCKIGRDFRLNVASKKLIAQVEYIRIGVRNNKLIIAPCQGEEVGCYKLNKEKHSAGIGGDKLLRQLKKLGIGEGRYLLTKNGKGWLVGELLTE